MPSFTERTPRPRPAPDAVVDPLEARIDQAERDLGIHTQAQRLLEARLLIDKPFFEVALITGHPHPERIFGEEEWASYLAARTYAKKYGIQPLRTPFLVGLHLKLAQRIKPTEAGEFNRWKDARHGPVRHRLSESEHEALNSNPLLRFKYNSDSNNADVVGYIVYPPFVLQEMREELNQLSDDYNREKHNPEHNPYQLAAVVLQRKTISLHPFTYDYHGRLTKIAMNWSLENSGLSPAILDDVDADMLSSEQAWVEQVTNGSRRYEAYKRRITEDPDIDPVSLFGLDKEKDFYEQQFRHSHPAPHLSNDNQWKEHRVFESYLQQLRAELQKSHT